MGIWLLAKANPLQEERKENQGKKKRGTNKVKRREMRGIKLEWKKKVKRRKRKVKMQQK